MAATTLTKTPSDREAFDAFAVPAWAAPEPKRLGEEKRSESETLEHMDTEKERIRQLRENGAPNAVLLNALASATSDADRERQRLRVAMLTERVREAEAAERQRREDLFWAYAKPQVKRLIADLDGVLDRNAAFTKVCEARHDAISGTVQSVESPCLPQLRGIVEAFRQWAKKELGLD
jgi:hypothetical protein